MNLIDCYHNIIEINRHVDSIIKVNSSIEEESNRVKKIKGQVDATLEKLKHNEEGLKALNTEIRMLENDYEDVTTIIDKAIDNIDSISDNKQLVKLESSILENKESLKRIEDMLFDAILKKEEFDEIIMDQNNFVNGAESTLEEITSEVDSKVLEFNNSKENYLERINALLPETHPSFQSIFKRSFLKLNPLIAFLQNNSCSLCKFEQDKSTVAEITNYQAVTQCSSCDRVLLPEHLPAQ